MVSSHAHCCKIHRRRVCHRDVATISRRLCLWLWAHLQMPSAESTYTHGGHLNDLRVDVVLARYARSFLR